MDLGDLNNIKNTIKEVKDIAQDTELRSELKRNMDEMSKDTNEKIKNGEIKRATPLQQFAIGLLFLIVGAVLLINIRDEHLYCNKDENTCVKQSSQLFVKNKATDWEAKLNEIHGISVDTFTGKLRTHSEYIAKPLFGSKPMTRNYSAKTYSNREKDKKIKYQAWLELSGSKKLPIFNRKVSSYDKEKRIAERLWKFKKALSKGDFGSIQDNHLLITDVKIIERLLAGAAAVFGLLIIIMIPFSRRKNR